ncbi:MAG TPA: hypothetical protein VHT27_06030 [Solirubrobacteraceae bacterium]|jgi:hypothetical protein|nr:hypothetical protein [Solirubrobacteraceae bacterium]
MTTIPTPDVDTAMVLGMASTALPFADTPEAEAERWLRILRMYGEAGEALQSLGVSEGPLEGGAEGEHRPETADSGHSDAIRAVTERAVGVAVARGSRVVSAGDVLVAVMDVYGEYFDRVLHVHGTDRSEVLLRLETVPISGAMN